MPLIESDRIGINSVRDNTANTRNLRGGQTTANRIGHERSTEAHAPKCMIDGQTANEQNGHRIRHPPPQFGARQRDSLLDGRRNRVVPNDTGWRIDIADDVCSR